MLWITVAALAVIAVLASGVVYAMLEVLSGGRAYVHGEGRWSKAQQAVVFNLDRYAETGQPHYLSQARRSLQVPLGDRQARLALLGPAYDYERAYRGFLRGANHPADIPTMIWLFEHFENAPYFREAIRIWSRADPDIVTLRSIADRLEAQWSSDSPDSRALAALRDELTRIDRRLRPLENRFSQVLGQGLLQLKIAFNALSAVIFLALAGALLLVFRWAVRHISDSERRFRATVEHAPVGVALLKDGGRFTHVNDALCGTLGYGRDELLGLSLEDILVQEDDAGPDDLLRRAADAGDPGVTVEIRCLKRDLAVLWCKLNLAPFPGERNQRARGAGEFIATLEDVSEARHMSEKLSYQATHDPLTGLLNRRRFEADLAEALEDARIRNLPHTVGFVDLNDFKQVNDTAGHLAGDRLLETIAAAMRGQLRANDSLARLGGDEFGFILYGCDIERGLQTAGSLRHAVREAGIECDGRRLQVLVSIGLVELTAAAAGPVAVMQAADRACYQAKQEAGSGIVVGHAASNEERTN